MSEGGSAPLAGFAPAAAEGRVSRSERPATSPSFRTNYFASTLAASRVAQGYGGGNFCPNQPVTRGEVAKFLANALGLHGP